MKDVDGLISANGITYLISLVVALLISLVSDRVIAMEGLMRKVHELRDQTKRETVQFKEINKSFYGHTTNYNSLLNRIASVFNLSIMISNVTTSISDQNNDNDMRIAKEAGVLCSRLSLICDQIDIKVLTYLTTDEKDILITYLDDALNGLDHGVENAKSVTNELLRKRIEECIGLVKGIKEIVDDIEERNE